MWSLILATVASYAKKNWKGIALVLAIVLIVSGVYFWLHGLYSELDEVKAQNKNLENSLMIRDALLEHKDEIIRLQGKSLAVFGEISKSEKVAENHYHEKVIENKTIVEKYMDSEKSSEDQQKFFDIINEKWKSVDGGESE